MINQNILDKVNQIPPLSPTVVEVLNLINSDENVDFAVLEKKIIQDPGLTGKILSMANSPFFGLAGEIVNVREACLVLGINIIKNLVISSAIMKRFNNDYGNNLDFKKIWIHSVGVAAAAKVYSEKLGFDKDTAFIGGLLHDIGKMVLDYYLPDEYSKVIKYKMSHDCLLVDAEKNILGTDHSEVGAIVLRNWKLPDEISLAIASHHNPVDPETKVRLSDLIQISDITSQGLGYLTLQNSIIPIKDDALFSKPGISMDLIKDSLPMIEAITESYIDYD